MSKTKYVFLENQTGGSGQEFEAGKAYELRDDAADHYLRRGKVMTEADYKASQKSRGRDNADEKAESGDNDNGGGSAGRSGARS